MKKIFRPDLTEYLPYIELLSDLLNETGAYRMSRTDAVKIAIERAVEKLVPGMAINKKRKLYVKGLEF